MRSKRGFGKHFLVKIGLVYTLSSLVACQTSLPSGTQTNQDQTVLTLAPVTEEQESITLTQGTKVQIFKDTKLLTEVTLEENNQLKLSPLQEAPPYKYIVSSAVIKDIQFSRLLPIGTQGGLVTAPSGQPVSAPPALTPTPSPSSLSPNQKISFEGVINQDLRQKQQITLDEVMVKVSE